MLSCFECIYINLLRINPSPFQSPGTSDIVTIFHTVTILWNKIKMSLSIEEHRILYFRVFLIPKIWQFFASFPVICSIAGDLVAFHPWLPCPNICTSRIACQKAASWALVCVLHSGDLACVQQGCNVGHKVGGRILLMCIVLLMRKCLSSNIELLGMVSPAFYKQVVQILKAVHCTGYNPMRLYTVCTVQPMGVHCVRSHGRYLGWCDGASWPGTLCRGGEGYPWGHGVWQASFLSDRPQKQRRTQHEELSSQIVI